MRGKGGVSLTLVLPAKTLLTSILLSLVVSGAQAQESSVLSLNGALERAIEHNPDYQQVVNNLELSEVERMQAWAAYLPTLSIGTSTRVSFNRQLIAFDEFGNPVENPVTEWRTSSATSQSLSGSVTLFQWGARSRAMAAQKAQARAREASVTAQVRSLRADVVRAYRNAQSQAALLSVERSLLESRQLDLETAQRRFELAGATRVDVLTAELEVQQQEQRIREAEGQLDQALLSLRTVIGDENLDRFQVESTLPEAFDPSLMDSETLAQRAYSSSPQLIVQEANVEVSRAQAQSQRRAHWPGLAINFSASQSTGGDQLEYLAAGFPDRSRSGGASLGLSIPVFQGFDNKARIVQAEVSQVNQEETLRRTRLQVEELVRARFIALQTAHESYLISLRSRDIAQERLRLGREQFRLGSRTFVELQQDINASAQAERAVISQFFALERALADLEETVGEELR